MLRTVLASLLALAFALPAHAQEPPVADEPMPNHPAPSAPPAPPAATAPPAPAAPAPEPAAATPAAAAPAAAPVAAPAAAVDAQAEEIIPNPPKIYALAFGGAAVGALLVGSILGGVAISRSNEQNGNVAMPPLYTHDLQGRGNAGGSMATSSYVFFAIGGALAATDAVLWYETYRKPRTVKHAPEGGKQ